MSKEYHIHNFESDDISPEETLADFYSQHHKIEAPLSQIVIRVFYGLIALVLLFFAATAFRLQVIRGPSFRQLALSNRSAIYDLPAMRGEIKDQDGKVLANNQPVFDLVVISADLPKSNEQLNSLAADLGAILGEKKEAVTEKLAQRQQQAIFFLKKDLAKEQVLQIQNKYERGVYPVSAEYAKKQGRGSTSREAALTNGIYVINNVQRIYPQGTKFSSVVGYTGKIGAEDLQDNYYHLNDRKGRAGLEASYEVNLRGEHGRIFFDRANKRYLSLPAQPGNSLILNLQSKVQTTIFDSLNEIMRAHGLRKSAAVVLDPRNGAVLGLVSFPAYDNNELSAEIDEDVFKKYFTSQERPLFNRAISGKYNPGSTIKPLLALAGLKEKVITPQTTITDQTGYITVPNIYNPDIVYTYRDWRIQGTVNLKKALAWSSDIFFYSVGGGYGKIKGLGFALLEKYFRAFLIDRALGIDLPSEAAGFVPDENWKLARFGQPWFVGDTFNVSIGQGDLVVTPLWLGSYISAIANGGTFYRPWLVKNIIDKQGKITETKQAEALTSLPFDQETIRIVQDGLREVVVSGTSQLLNTLPVKVAAKTGTAEVIKGRNLNSFLAAYAPYENPEIAVAIVVESINNQQGLALQVAKLFFEKYFEQRFPGSPTHIP